MKHYGVYPLIVYKNTTVNPSKHPNGPIYESQINTIKNDMKKNKIRENTENLNLLRFWESDINERPEWVKSELLKHIS